MNLGKVELSPPEPIVGAPRDESCSKTISVITEKLHGLSRLQGRRLLDVGCGDGSITLALSGEFEEVYGIDVQDDWLRRFKERVRDDRKFRIH